MRRFTLITIICLFVLLVIAAVFQFLAGRKDVRYPGPGFTATPRPSFTG